MPSDDEEWLCQECRLLKDEKTDSMQVSRVQRTISKDRKQVSWRAFDFCFSGKFPTSKWLRDYNPVGRIELERAALKLSPEEDPGKGDEEEQQDEIAEKENQENDELMVPRGQRTPLTAPKESLTDAQAKINESNAPKQSNANARSVH